jgi:hypothetical protein
MQQLIRQFRSALLTAVGISILIAAPVAAKDGSTTTIPSDDSGTTTSTATTPPAATAPATTQSHESVHTTQDASTTHVKATDNAATHSTASDDKPVASQLKVGELRTQAQQELQTERKAKPEHTEAQRQKSCTDHQTDINNRITSLGKNAQKHLNDFSATFTKVEAFQTKQHLAANDYASLQNTALTDQVIASNAVNTLSSLTVTIDCSATDPAASVATVKQAANDAKIALLTFRTDIKAMITSLQAAKPGPAPVLPTGDDTPKGTN